MGAKGSRVSRFLIIVACAALLLVMPSGAIAGASSSPAPATVLRLGTTQDLDSLNPFAGYTSTAYEVYHLNYDMLTGNAPDGGVRPEIADSWEVSADGLTWTFSIHPGIRWQDGVPLTAARRSLHVQLHHRQRALGVHRKHHAHQEGRGRG